MNSTDVVVVTILGVAAYLVYREWKRQGGAARAYYAADQDDRDLGAAMRANQETVSGFSRAPSGATWDGYAGGWRTLDGMLYT